MNPMQMLQGMKNPQQFLQQMMGNKSVMNNPMARNAMQMAQREIPRALSRWLGICAKKRELTQTRLLNRLKVN